MHCTISASIVYTRPRPFTARNGQVAASSCLNTARRLLTCRDAQDVNTHPPRQPKAAVTAVAISICPDRALTSCVRLPAAPAQSVFEANGPLGSANSGIEHMTFITSAQRQKLFDNGRAQRDAIDRQDQVLDFEPVVKLFTRGAKNHRKGAN